MEANLLCPMQMCTNDIRVNEVPKFLTNNPTNQSHAISFPNDDGYTIPLLLKGVTLYFPTRRPTLGEYEQCRQIELIYEAPEWNPHSISFTRQEESMINSFGRVRDDLHQNRYKDRCICVLDTTMQMNAASGGSRQQAQDIVDKNLQCSSVLSEGSNTLQDDPFYAALLEQVRVSNTSTKRKNMITAKRLATTWNIGIEAAKKTI
jgi:hypothetical protein